MSVGAGPVGLRHRRRGLGRSLRSRTRIFCPAYSIFNRGFPLLHTGDVCLLLVRACTSGAEPSTINEVDSF